MNEQISEQILSPYPRETEPGQLFFNFEALANSLRESAGRVENYGTDCDDSLAAEQNRVRALEEVSAEAKQYSLGLQDQLRGSYNELSQASKSYIALLGTKQATETVADEKQAALESEQANQQQLNDSAKQVHDCLKAVVINKDVDGDRNGYHRSLQEKRSNLGNELFYSGGNISRLQAELEGIRSEEIPALEARIEQELTRVERLHAAVTAITEQIGDLVVPADDPSKQELLRVRGNAIANRKISNAVTTMPEAMAPVNELPAPRPRKIGEAAVRSLDIAGGFLERTHTTVNLVPTK